MPHKKCELPLIADGFQKAADDFDEFISREGLASAKVDMAIGIDVRTEAHAGAELSSLAFCHGGWLSVMYGCKNSGTPGSFYKLGANRLAKLIGFPCMHTLRLWAASHPTIWGGVYGDCMFHSPRAFGKTKITYPACLFELRLIPNRYRQVAKNCLAKLNR